MPTVALQLQDIRGEFISLGPPGRARPGGNLVSAWAFEADCDPAAIQSNLFSIEWRPRSRRTREFPEIDRAEWFPMDVARQEILKGQDPLDARAPGKDFRRGCPNRADSGVIIVRRL